MKIMDSQHALERLKDGNHRYVGGRAEVDSDLSLDRARLCEGQAPFTAIVSCSDSRVPPEIVFDMGLGELFVVRTAGNAACDVVTGSVEFAAKILGVQLVVVMGHTDCAAVEAVASGQRYGSYMDTVLAGIRPDVDENIRHAVDVLQKSPVLAGLCGEGKLTIIGAKYDMGSGMVDFWE